LLFSTILHLARREPAEVCRVYDELAALCRAHGIAQELQWGAPFRGRALVELGQIDRGLAELKEGLAAHTLTRSALMRPYYLVLYAGALLRARRFDEAKVALDESRAVADATSQHAYDSEHRRLEAEVLLKHGRADEAEPLYRESLAIAREQGARWLELRAARGYASFLIERHRTAEAREALRICESIVEGRATMDYVFADALLRTL
jgi:tetratricopeptide (TPR) repeat protein